MGDHVYPVDRHNEGNQGQRVLYRYSTDLANTLLNGLVQRDFDVASSKSFPREELLAHAHAPILRRIIPEADIPVVLNKSAQPSLVCSSTFIRTGLV